MTSQSGKQIIAIHTVPNISRSKGNKATKFGQLIEYYKKNIFLEKSFTSCCGETVPRPFSKKKSESFDQQCKLLYSFFFEVILKLNLSF